MNPPTSLPALLSGDHYDVLLAVSFGFCYGSALEPIIRMRKSEDARLSETGTSIFCAVRGLLTVVGLACLYGWYAYYLRTPYMRQLPPGRMLLDWISIGLFAVGANWWNNRKQDDTLYCYVQTAAIVTFGITCLLGFKQHDKLDYLSAPMFVACFWCMALSSSFFYAVVISRLTKHCFDHGGNATKRKVFGFVLGSLVALTIILLIDRIVMKWLFGASVTYSEITRIIQRSEIVTSLVLLFVCHIGYAVAAFFVNDHTAKKRLITIAITLIPLAALIAVTVLNQSTLFPQNP